jgi:hypothetical protein
VDQATLAIESGEPRGPILSSISRVVARSWTIAAPPLPESDSSKTCSKTVQERRFLLEDARFQKPLRLLEHDCLDCLMRRRKSWHAFCSECGWNHESGQLCSDTSRGKRSTDAAGRAFNSKGRDPCQPWRKPGRDRPRRTEHGHGSSSLL